MFSYIEVVNKTAYNMLHRGIRYGIARGPEKKGLPIQYRPTACRARSHTIPV